MQESGHGESAKKLRLYSSDTGDPLDEVIKEVTCTHLHVKNTVLLAAR